MKDLRGMMRRLYLILTCTGLAFVQAVAQPGTSSYSDGPHTVYYNSKELVLPELIAPRTESATVDNCPAELKGEVKLELIVDSTGAPRNIVFEKPAGNDLDILALKLVEADRFKPGSLSGAAVAVGLSVELPMDACLFPSKDSAGKDEVHLRLRSMPEQKLGKLHRSPMEVSFNPISAQASGDETPYKIGGKVSAPIPIFQPLAEFAGYARQKGILGKTIVSLIVDAHGIPQNVHLALSLEAYLDEKAIEAAHRYRFKPGMIDGRPVGRSLCASTLSLVFEISEFRSMQDDCRLVLLNLLQPREPCASS